jgi:two-component system OmpR family response regulator
LTDHNAWRPSILIAEDDPTIGELLVLALTRAGFLPRLATDGRQALADLTRTAPDLLLLDIGLPEMDGLAVLGILRPSSDLPILVMTARHSEADVQQALRLGADDYITKPFEMPVLIRRVQRLLSRRRSAGSATVPLSENGDPSSLA